MNHNMEIESRLRALEERRNFLDKKIEAKLDTITKFNEIKQNSRLRLNAALDKQDAEAKIRNAELMKRIMSIPLGSTLLAQRKCVIDHEEKLNEAKDLYSRQMEIRLPAMHRNQSMLLEQKINEIKSEKQQSIMRRNKLNQELVYEERVKLELEKQRRELLSSLALEQHDIMQAQANSIMMAMDGAEADRLVYEQVEAAGNNLRGLISNSLNRNYGNALEDIRQQQQQIRSFNPPQYNPPQYNFSSNYTNKPNDSVNAPPVHSKQGRSFTEVSTGDSDDNSMSIHLNQSLERSIVEQKISEPADTRYRLLVESPQTSQREGIAMHSTPASVPTSARLNIETSTPAEPLASPRSDRTPVPVLVTSIKVTPASPASVVASPTVNPPPAVPSINLRNNQSLYVSEDEFDDTDDPRGLNTVDAVNILPRIESEESFPSIPEDTPKASPRPPAPTVAESVAALHKVLSSTSDCVKCLRALFATIENRVMFITSINHIYTYTPANDTDASGNSYRDSITEFLTLLLDPSSTGTSKLEKFNENDRLVGDTVMRILEAKAFFMIPKDAFMGVMTLEKLKKEHKKLAAPGPIIEMWDTMTGHLQRLVEANSTYLTYLSSAFTSVLISHIPQEDKDRLNRKVSALLQLSMIPPSTDGNRSPSPPYRSNSRRLEESQPVEQAKLTNRFNDVAATSTAPPSSVTSRPALITKQSSRMAYDSMQVPTKSASEFDDEEFLEEESLQAPPSMKDLDEIHSGGQSRTNKSTNNVGKVIQVGSKNKNWDRDVNNSNADEFDF